MNDDVIVAAGHATKYIKHLSDISMMMLLLLQAMVQNIKTYVGHAVEPGEGEGQAEADCHRSGDSRTT